MNEIKCENCSTIQLIKRCQNCTLAVCPKCYIVCNRCNTRYCVFCADEICWSYEKEEYLIFDDDVLTIQHSKPVHENYMKTYVKYTVCCNN